MASKEPEDPSNNTAETDEETVAVRRKRLRRVSFADREITSVHVFKRDEDYETPPNSSASKPLNSDNAGAGELEKEALGFFRDLADSEDSRELLSSSPDEEDGDGEDAIVDGKLFLRPRGSPSSGGSTIGSATSNDEDKFFGPVSAHFIRPGRLSDSAASDENHDVTMDSTAFSMHFRSLVRSEAGDLKTPTKNHLPFEEKTPSEVSCRSDTGNVMVLTKAKIPKSPPPIGKVSGGGDSNDMSLVGDNLCSFDYGRLSPRLEALLAEGGKDLLAASTHDTIEATSPRIDPSMSHQGWTSGTGQRNHGDTEKHGVDDMDVYAEGASSELAKENEVSYKVPSRSSMLIAESPAPNDTLLDKNYEGQHNLQTHQESGSQPYTEDLLKHDSAKEGRQNLSIDQIFSQQFKSPLVGSVYSSAIKGQDVCLDTENRSLYYVTPSPKQHGSFLSRKSFKLVESLSSIQKSKSRIKLISTSSPASALKDRIQKSKLALSEYLSSTATPSNIGRQEVNKSLQSKHADVPITNLEEELSNSDPRTSLLESSTNTGKDGIGFLSSDVDVEALSKDGTSLNDVYASIIQDKPTNLATRVMSLSKQDERYCLVGGNRTEGTSLINSDSLPGEITFDDRNSKQENSTPRKFAAPPLNGLNVKRPSSTDYTGLQWQDQRSGPVSISGIKEEQLIENFSGVNCLAGRSDKLNSAVVESSSLSSELNFSNGSAQLKRVDIRESSLLEMQNITRNIRSSVSPRKSRDNQEFQSGSLGESLQMATHVTYCGEEFREEMMEKRSGPSASLFVEPRKSEPSLAKLSQSTSLVASSVKKRVPSPSNNDLHNTRHEKNLPIVEEGVPSPEPDLNGSMANIHNEGSMLLSSIISDCDTESSNRLKRKNQNADLSVKINGAQRSPKVLKGREHVLELVQDHLDGDMNGNKSIRGGAELKDWNGVSRKLSRETYEFIAPLADQLNLRLMAILEDILESLKKGHLYEVLRSEIKSQKGYDKLSRDKIKRHTETRSLLCKIAYGKAKQQLLQLRRERLLKRVQTVSSGIQESEMLRLSYAKCQYLGGETDAQANDGSHSLCLERHEVTTDKGTKIKQESEVLETKIMNLTKSLHIYCKMQGEPTCSETIAFLGDRLKEKMCCRFIRQDMQLWGVDALQSWNGNKDIVLNYSGFVNQRLTVKPGPVSALLISNKVNDAVLGTYFPKMDASTAFATMFSTETVKKCIVSKTLAQETQTTSLLLCNLLDVIEELQLAQIELQNLVHANFNSPSGGLLYLRLIFVDCSIIGTVIMTLDISCLTRGIYPSDIVPCKLLQVYACGAETSLPESRSTEIKSAIDSVGVGYPRILKLCRCVSQVFQL